MLLVSAAGERELTAADLYRNDGIDYLSRRPDEILTEVRLPPAEGWKRSYWKLRRRGAFDFPVLGVAAAVRTGPDGTVEDARIALGAVASRPFRRQGRRSCSSASSSPTTRSPRPARRSPPRAKPLDNADLDIYWRKEVVGAFVGYALREIRGDDMRATRRRIARHEL